MPSPPAPPRSRKEDQTMKVKDPVCGMTIEEQKAAGTSVYEGTTYRFCSTACKEKFDKNPGAYVVPGTGKKEKAA